MKLDLEFTGDVPAGWTPLEATAVVKCLDEAGVVRIFARTTPGLNSWEDLGMLDWAVAATKRDLLTCTEEGEP